MASHFLATEVVGRCKREACNDCRTAALKGSYMQLEVEAEHGFSDLWHPALLLQSFDQDLVWDVAVLFLSTRNTPFPQSRGQVMAEFSPEPRVLLWEGTGERHRGPRATANEDNGGERGGEEPSDEVDAHDWLDALAEAAHPPPAQQDAGGYSSSSSSSSESSGSSSNSTVANQNVAQEAPLQQGVDMAAPAQGPPAEVDGGPAHRRRRPESFEWGNAAGPQFRFTYKPPASYECLCRLHMLERTRCTKTCSWREGDDESRAVAVKRLKLWALSGAVHVSRVAHQGRRGCPALSEADEAITEADLEERLLAMPPV